jgi:hypothetical protein
MLIVLGQYFGLSIYMYENNKNKPHNTGKINFRTKKLFFRKTKQKDDETCMRKCSILKKFCEN